MSQPLNLMDPAVRANPYPLYEELRCKPPQQVEPGGMWAISRYDDVLEALKSPQLTTAAYLPMFQPAWLKHNLFADSILAKEPPQHTRLRSLVNHAFTAAGLARLEGRIQLIADVLAEQLVKQREVDIVYDWAMALPAHVIGDMLVLPPAMHPHIKQFADLMTTIPGIQQPSPEQITRIKTDLALMERTLLDIVKERRRHPGDDMISDLIRAEAEGHRLTDEEIVSFGGFLMMAGVETTTHLLSTSMFVLSEQPALFDRVRAERGRLLPQFVEEMLRFEAPAQTIFRWTVAPLELGGAQLPAGATLALLLGAAARDPKHYPEPDAFRLDRREQAHIPFGHGIHYCLGSILTRLETSYGLKALLLRLSSFSRKPGEIRWAQAMNVRGPVSLPVLLDPK